jgi:hypothetical protein
MRGYWDLIKTARDRLQLRGSASEYLIGDLPAGTFDSLSDIAIYKDNLGSGQYSPSQEPIAIIQKTP